MLDFYLRFIFFLFSCALYKDLRAAYLFIGLVEDLIGYLYKKSNLDDFGACAFSKLMIKQTDFYQTS